MEKIALAIIYGLELVRMWIMIPFLFGGKIKRAWLGIVGYAVFIGFIFHQNYSFSSSGIVMIAMIFGTLLLTTEDNIHTDWSWYFKTGFVFLYQEELISMLVRDITYYKGKLLEEYMLNVIDSILSLIIMLIVVILLHKYKGKVQMKGIYNRFKKAMIPMLVSVLVLVVFQVASFNYVAQKYGNNKLQTSAMIVSFMSMISIGILVIVVFYIRYQSEKMEQMLSVEKLMQQQQVQYYEALLKKEEETRKYRHDMNAHMMSINGMLKSGDYESAQLYIDDMMGHMESIVKSTYVTGNRIIDSVLNYYIGQLPMDVEVNVEGRIKALSSVSDMDVCTIFSNLLKNSVEAIKKCENKNRLLNVKIDEGEMYVKVCIENSMGADDLQWDKEGRLITSKRDKKNHGIGMINAKDTAQKNGGNLDVYVQDNLFCCDVILKK